jgi:hypothetical protein
MRRLIAVAVTLAACASNTPPPVAPAPAPTPAPQLPRAEAAPAAPDLDALIATAQGPTTQQTLRAQVDALRAIGQFTGERDKAATALVAILARPAPPHPRTATDPAQRRALEQSYMQYLAVSGAAINALGELRVASTAAPLVLAMYRTPELSRQTRRALVAVGPTAETALRVAMRGEDAGVNALFAAAKLGQYCGERGDEPCRPVSALEFYPATVLGDFHDPAVVPDLLAVLKHPAAPAYYFDGEPSANTQYNAVFDALRKLGAPEAAAPLRALWSDAKTELTTRVLAIAAYAYCARDDAGVAQLGKIAADNTADDELRIEAASAYARLARNAGDIKPLEKLAARYLDASAKKAKQAAAQRATVAAADRKLDAARTATEAARAKTLAITRDSTKTADEIRAQTAALRKVDAAYKAAVHAHREAIAPFKTLDAAAKAYVGYARMFQLHVARVEIATRCKQDAACFADSLRASPDDVAARDAPYLKDLAAWTPDDKRALAGAAIDRAMIELAKQGAAAAVHTDALLRAVTSDDRDVRRAILLALPHVATLPCAACAEQLDAAVHTGEGKTTLVDLNVETAILRDYFQRAGR